MPPTPSTGPPTIGGAPALVAAPPQRRDHKQRGGNHDVQDAASDPARLHRRLHQGSHTLVLIQSCRASALLSLLPSVVLPPSAMSWLPPRAGFRLRKATTLGSARSGRAALKNAFFPSNDESPPPVSLGSLDCAMHDEERDEQGASRWLSSPALRVLRHELAGRGLNRFLLP
jgi:hypothetical protein